MILVKEYYSKPYRRTIRVANEVLQYGQKIGLNFEYNMQRQEFISKKRVRILTQISKPMLLTTVLPRGLTGYKYSTKYGAYNSSLFIFTGLVYLTAFILSHSKLGLEKI